MVKLRSEVIYDKVLSLRKKDKNSTISQLIEKTDGGASQFYAYMSILKEQDPTRLTKELKILYPNGGGPSNKATPIAAKTTYKPRRKKVPEMITIEVDQPEDSKMAAIVGTPKQVAEALNNFL